MDTLSTDAPITPLRQRMQQDMLMRGLGSHTQQDYVRAKSEIFTFQTMVAQRIVTALVSNIESAVMRRESRPVALSVSCASHTGHVRRKAPTHQSDATLRVLPAKEALRCR